MYRIVSIKKEGKILNLIVRWMEQGFEFEAVRHVDMMVADHGLTDELSLSGIGQIITSDGGASNVFGQ